MITKQRKASAIALAIQSSLLLFSASSSAAGFYLHEHSSNGLGRAFAGQAAMPENATVQYANPAAMAAFDKANLSIFVSHIEPGIDVEGEVTISTPANSVTLDASQDDISDGEVIPAAFYVQPLNDKWTFGLGLLGNFGLSTDFDPNYNALHFGDKAEIKSINLNPSFAYKVSEQLSLGFGVSAVYAEAELGTSVPNVISAAVGGLVPAQAALAEMKGDDWGFGWNVGAFWTPTTSTTLGLSYRSTTNFDLSGDLSSDVVANYNQGGELKLELPDIAELALSQKVTDDLSIQASVNWFGWSSFDVLEAELDDGSSLLIGEEGFQNNWKFSLGTTYQLNSDWVLRAGYAYDEGAATREHRSLNIPDTDRQWYSAGSTYQLNESMNIDFALLKVVGKEAQLDEQSSVGPISSTLFAEQSSSATILSLQLNLTL